MSTVETDIETTLEPGRNRLIEQDLAALEVDYKFLPEVKSNQFNKEKSLDNQARFQAIDQSTVDLYTAAVQRGDVFPAVLAYRPVPRQRLVMIDGNHRLAAHIAADAPMACYEVDGDTHPRTIALLTFAANTRHGKPTSEDERVFHAIYLVDNGASIDHAAAAVSLPVRILRRALGRNKADARADQVGLRRNEWDSLSATAKTRLQNVSTDEGFRGAANLAYRAKLDVNEIADLVPKLNESKSGQRQEALIKQFTTLYQDRIQAGAGGVLGTAHRRVLGPKQRVSMAIAQFMALPDVEFIVNSYAVPERADAAKLMREASMRLASIADLLAPAAR